MSNPKPHALSCANTKKFITIYNPGPGFGPGSGSGSKLGQKSGSRSKFNIFESTTLVALLFF